MKPWLRNSSLKKIQSTGPWEGPIHCSRFVPRVHKRSTFFQSWSWSQEKNATEATNPTAVSKSWRRRSVPTEQWQEMLDRIKSNSCRTLLLDTPLGQWCGTLLRDTLVAYSCKALLWDTFMGHPCEILLPDTLVAHSGKTLSLNTLKHSCKTLLLGTSGTPRGTTSTLYYEASTLNLTVFLYTANLAQSNSKYYFVIQILHKALPSNTL